MLSEMSEKSEKNQGSIHVLYNIQHTNTNWNKSEVWLTWDKSESSLILSSSVDAADM